MAPPRRSLLLLLAPALSSGFAVPGAGCTKIRGSSRTGASGAPTALSAATRRRNFLEQTGALVVGAAALSTIPLPAAAAKEEVPITRQAVTEAFDAIRNELDDPSGVDILQYTKESDAYFRKAKMGKARKLLTDKALKGDAVAMSNALHENTRQQPDGWQQNECGCTDGPLCCHAAQFAGAKRAPSSSAPRRCPPSLCRGGGQRKKSPSPDRPSPKPSTPSATNFDDPSGVVATLAKLIESGSSRTSSNTPRSRDAYFRKAKMGKARKLLTDKALKGDAVAMSNAEEVPITRQAVTEAFDAIRNELDDPSGVVATLAKLIESGSFEDILQYTKESDAYFRKAKMGKARKLLTDKALKGDAVAMSNAVTKKSPSPDRPSPAFDAIRNELDDPSGVVATLAKLIESGSLEDILQYTKESDAYFRKAKMGKARKLLTDKALKGDAVAMSNAVTGFAVPGASCTKIRGSSRMGGSRMSAGAPAALSAATRRNLLEQTGALVVGAAALSTIPLPAAAAKGRSPHHPTGRHEAFDAIRNELDDPSGVVATLAKLIESGSFEDILQYTKESDAYFRKAKMGKARKLLTDKALKGDAVAMSNAEEVPITRQAVTEAFDAIRNELDDPSGVVATLAKLIESGSFEDILQYTKESDAYFRKAKMGKARKLLTDKALKGDAVAMSNAVTGFAVPGASCTKIRGSSRMGGSRMSAGAPTALSAATRRNLLEQTGALVVGAAALSTIPLPAAAAKEEVPITRQAVTEAFDAIRNELNDPSGVVATLAKLIESGSFEDILQYTKESDAYFRKAKMGKARKLLTDKALKGDAVAMSNAVTFDLIGINRASRPGKENKGEQQRYLEELKKDIGRFLELEGTIVVE
ncbi:hypothetical protein ACHAXT_009000 [Thalassiosira profunda]